MQMIQKLPIQCQRLPVLEGNCSYVLAVSVRLVNGTAPYEGRVEVYYRGEWGTVCDDDWDLDDASVVCRQLGYNAASHAWKYAHFGPGSGPILLDDVRCYGNESSIAACSHNSWYSHNCDNNETAGVTCGEDSTMTTPVSGKLIR